MMDPKPKDEHDLYSGYPYNLGERVFLDRAIVDSQKLFLDVLFSRRSTKSFSENILLKELSSLLYLSNKISSFSYDQKNYLTSKRTAPSAGGRHPVDILVSIENKDRRNLSLYNPVDHSISELLLDENSLGIFFDKISENLKLDNSCIIWFSIQVNKTGSKYENPESLYWRDAGALLYCLQLVAEYMGLKSCPLGTLAIEEFGNLFDDKRLVSGGGIYLGK